jgi:hypothetical protein
MANEFIPPPQKYTVSLAAGFGGFSKSRLASLLVLTHAFRSAHIERHYFFGRKPHGEWTLRAVNARIDLAVHLEIHP